MTTMIHKLPLVTSTLGRSRSALYRDMEAGLFPRPISLGVRSVGWPSDEVDLVLNARIAGQSDDEIRALVKQIKANRKTRVQGGEA